METACEACRIAAGDPAPPGGVHEVSPSWTLNWRVDGPTRPWLVLQTKAHRGDLDELTPAERTELGLVLPRVTAALKRAAGAERVYVGLFNELGHVHFHLVPRFAGDTQTGASLLVRDFPAPAEPSPEEMGAAVAEAARLEGRGEPHKLVSSVVKAHKWFDAHLSPYRPLMRRFWESRQPADFAPVYVTGWLVLLLGALLTAELWRPSEIAAISISIVAAYRWLDLVLYEVGVIVDRETDLLAGFERSLILAVLNLVELGLIGAIWLEALNGAPTGETWLHAFGLTTLTTSPVYDGFLGTLAQVLVQVGAMVFIAGAIAILIGVLGARFREKPAGDW